MTPAPLTGSGLVLTVTIRQHMRGWIGLLGFYWRGMPREEGQAPLVYRQHPTFCECWKRIRAEQTNAQAVLA